MKKHFKQVNLLVLFILIPFLCFAEGQAGLENIFYFLFFISFLITTVAGGFLLNGSLIKLRINFGIEVNMIITFIISWILFYFDKAMFLFPMSMVYLVPFVLIYFLLPNIDNSDKGGKTEQ